MKNLNFDSHSHLKMDFQDLSAIGTVIFLSIAANLPSDFALGLDKKYLIGGLAAVLAVALVKYLRFTLVMTITVLVLGANLPRLVSPHIDYTPWMMTLTLTLLVILGLLNKAILVPDWLDPDSDAEPLSESLHGARAMFSAITDGRARSVRALLRQGVDPNIRAQGGETPLMYAVARNKDYIVQMLLDAGADINLTNNEGYTALKVAEIKDLDMHVALLTYAAAKGQ